MLSIEHSILCWAAPLLDIQINAHLLTYQTPMGGDLLSFRMKKQEVYKRDNYFKLKILVNKKSKHMIQTLLYTVYTSCYAVCFDVLLQLSLADFRTALLTCWFLILFGICNHWSTFSVIFQFWPHNCLNFFLHWKYAPRISITCW